MTRSLRPVLAAQPTLAFVLLGFCDQTGPGGLLPFDLGLIGAPRCQLLVSMDVQLRLVTDAAGNATVPIPIPDNPDLLGLGLFLQTLVVDGRSNALGLSATRGASSPPSSTRSPSAGSSSTSVCRPTRPPSLRPATTRHRPALVLTSRSPAQLDVFAPWSLSVSTPAQRQLRPTVAR